MRRAGLLAVAALVAACGGEGDRGDAPRGEDPFKQVRQDVERPAALHASPRWERVEVARGTGDATVGATIARGAIQWRARWRCSEGAFVLSGGGLASPARDRCPGGGVTTTAATTGRRSLQVRAAGSWRVEIEQQVETPLRESPLRAMRSPRAAVLAAGRFYGIERRGGGTATLHRLPGGRLAVRLEGFATSPNTDLYVWLSQAARPATSRAAFRSRHVSVALLRSTLGDQNYVVPRGVRAADIRSVVIWCEPVRIAYAAAALQPR